MAKRRAFFMIEKYGNFRVLNVCDLAEINCTLTELVHEPTGAQVLHLANDDEENLFNLSFRTWPEKSNGVAHILEHTVLCGSEKYPVRDPFFGMSRRSLNTFMNALTGADFTCYPVASQIPKDFYNLLEVYLDAVFKPKLTHLAFLQEGHRLEFLQPQDPNSPLVFKGVVFNEMKGALSSAEARLAEALMKELFPDLTYGVNSGGDPKEILNLSYEELREFHKKFYHPSRCLFYFYGNIPLERHLDFLEKHALEGVQKLSPLPPIPKQKRLQQKVVRSLKYPIPEGESTEDKTLVAMGWLTCSILEQIELLALVVLDVVLMGTDAAPLKMELLKSNLCKQADSVMDLEMSEIPYFIVCKGCQAEASDPLEHLIRTVLSQIAKEGLPPHLVEGAIHQLEMSRTEITGNTTPYGLSLYFRCALLKQHGGNPEDGLRIHSLFHKLRQLVEDPFYLPSLIHKHFLNNQHVVRIEMHPDLHLLNEEMAEEEEKLKEIASSLKDQDVQNLLKQAQELANYQELSHDENLDILPKVSLEDVSAQGKEFPLINETFDQLRLFCHPCFTNEITYVDYIYNLPDVAVGDLPYLRLFSLFLTQVGCGGRTYQQHLEYLLEHTGGIGSSLDLCLQAENAHLMRPALNIRGKALNRKVDKLFPIIRDVISSPDFTDVARVGELLKQHYHGVESSIHHSSLRYAINLAARGLSVPSTIYSQWYGIDYFNSLKKIVEEFESNPSSLIERLIHLQNQCLGLQGSDLILTCDSKTFERIKKTTFFGLNETPKKLYVPWQGNYHKEESLSQGRIIASPVAFTALMFSSISYTHPDAAALSIASEIMENKILHYRIREQGGAYGSGAVNSVLSGQFYFYSYRDPHLVKTIEAFREAIESLAKGDFDFDDLEEAKLGIFQDLDAPIAPGSRGMTAYSRLRGGRNPELRQRFREELFAKQKKDVQRAVATHLGGQFDQGVLVSFANKEFIEKENELLEKRALPVFNI